MAEAAVEDCATNRFFCHKCSIEITRVLEDYTCPTCRGGFIEELDSTNTSSDEPSDDHSDDEVEEFFSDVNSLGHFLFRREGSLGNQGRDAGNPDGDLIEGDGNRRQYRNETNLTLNIRPSVLALIFSLISSNRARHNNNSFRDHLGRYEANSNPTNHLIEDFYSLPGMEQFSNGNIFGRNSNSSEHSIQDLIVNIASFGWMPMGQGGRGNEPLFFLGNPGDYAWGREGLDAIVSQLLNQMDASGPPPLDKEKISEIPVTVIEQEQVDSNLQCSVCWDDFKIGEAVRKLKCEHFYHESCIVPWLELHGTCPICRKSLLSDQEEKAPTDSGNNTSSSNLVRMFHVIRSRASPNLRSGSSTSSSANNSSTSNSNSSNGRQPPPPPPPPPPPSDFQMDLEYE